MIDLNEANRPDFFELKSNLLDCRALEQQFPYQTAPVMGSQNSPIKLKELATKPQMMESTSQLKIPSERNEANKDCRLRKLSISTQQSE